MPVNLNDLITKLGASAPPQEADPFASFYDLRNVVIFPGAELDAALTQVTHAEGADGRTRFETAGRAIGHFVRMVREGRYGLDEAWKAARDWNAANLSPPWTDERLRVDFDRLVAEDVREKGPLAAPTPAISTASDPTFGITQWGVETFPDPAPTREWLVDGLIPLATPGTLAAPGDAGKSLALLNLALHITGAPPLSPDLSEATCPRFFGQPVTARGAAVILTAEDDKDEVSRRLASLASAEYRERCRGKLWIVPMQSAGGARALIQEGPNRAPVPTPFWHELRAQLSRIPDLKLIGLDPLTAWSAMDVEGSNFAGAALMTMLGQLAAETRATVMLTHHVTKGAPPENLSEARNSVRGAGALVNNGRWTLVWWEADERNVTKTLKALGQEERAGRASIVYFGGLAKGNAPGVKERHTFVRNPKNGLLEDVTQALRANTPRQDELDRAVHAALLAERDKNEHFCFTAGEKSLATAWEPLLRKVGLDLSRAKIKAAFDRMEALGWVERMPDHKKGQPLYEPVPIAG